jgi:hypothetical protein
MREEMNHGQRHESPQRKEEAEERQEEVSGYRFNATFTLFGANP